MNRDTLRRFRGALVKRRALLLDWVRRNGSSDQGSVCDEMLGCVNEAIDKIDHGEFGSCAVCHGEVESSRLALDYTVSVCLDCLSDVDRRGLERELEMAAEVQQNLLPRNVPALRGAEFAVHAQPAGIVGGDYFDFFPTPGCGQAVAIGDVMGKGLPASMLMSSLQASLRILGPEQEDLTDLGIRVNTLFRHNLSLIKFISLIMARVDPEERCVEYLNAGHNPALLWKASERAGYWLQPTGPAIGLVKDPAFRSERADFDPGDILVLYTDGLVEARNSAGEEFGVTGLLEFVAANDQTDVESLVSGLRKAVLTHGGSKLSDDLTLLVVKATPVS